MTADLEREKKELMELERELMELEREMKRQGENGAPSSQNQQ